VILADDRAHLRVQPGVSRQINAQPVGELDHVAAWRAEAYADVVRFEYFLLRIGQQLARERTVVRCVHGGDFDAARGAGGLDDLGATELDWREAGRLLRRGDVAAGLGAIPGGLVANVLDFFAEKECHVADHDQRGVLRRGNLGGGRIRQRRHRFRFLARTGVERGDLAVADVIGMRMAQQHDVDGAKARGFAAHDRLPGIVKDTHAGRVFEDGRAVTVAQFAWVRAEGRDLDVLCPRRSANSRQGKDEHIYSKIFHLHDILPEKTWVLESFGHVGADRAPDDWVTVSYRCSQSHSIH